MAISQLWDGEHVSVSLSRIVSVFSLESLHIQMSSQQSAVISCTGCWTPNRLCCFHPGVKCHPPPTESTGRRRCTACGRDNTSEPNNYIKVMERRNVLAISAGVRQQRGTCRESSSPGGQQVSVTQIHKLALWGGSWKLSVQACESCRKRSDLHRCRTLNMCKKSACVDWNVHGRISELWSSPPLCSQSKLEPLACQRSDLKTSEAMSANEWEIL